MVVLYSTDRFSLGIRQARHTRFLVGTPCVGATVVHQHIEPEQRVAEQHMHSSVWQTDPYRESAGSAAYSCSTKPHSATDSG